MFTQGYITCADIINLILWNIKYTAEGVIMAFLTYMCPYLPSLLHQFVVSLFYYFIDCSKAITPVLCVCAFFFVYLCVVSCVFVLFHTCLTIGSMSLIRTTSFEKAFYFVHIVVLFVYTYDMYSCPLT